MEDIMLNKIALAISAFTGWLALTLLLAWLATLVSDAYASCDSYARATYIDSGCVADSFMQEAIFFFAVGGIIAVALTIFAVAYADDHLRGRKDIRAGQLCVVLGGLAISI